MIYDYSLHYLSVCIILCLVSTDIVCMYRCSLQILYMELGVLLLRALIYYLIMCHHPRP